MRPAALPPAVGWAALGALAWIGGERLVRAAFDREPYWRRVVQSAQEGFVGMDAGGLIIEWNHEAERIFGWSRAEVIGRRVSEVIIPERLRAEHEAGLRRYLATGEGALIHTRSILPAIRRDGSELPVELTISPARRRGRRVFHAFLHDATDRRRTERYLKAQSEVTQVLLNCSSLREAGPVLLAVLGESLEWDAGALWLVDEQEQILRCAHTWAADPRRFRRFLAVTDRLVLRRGESLAGRAWERFESQWVDDLHHQGHLVQLKTDGVEPMRAALALPLRSHDRVLGVIELFHSAPYPRDEQLLSLISFIGLQVAQYLDRLRGSDLLERSRTVARTDELTGLPNRRAINEQLPERLADAREHGRRLSVAMIDLDRFKAYNDTHGHPAGDRLLKESAAGWRGQLRENDLLARYGGEEFLLVVSSGRDRALEILERVRAATPHGQTCSAGLAEWDGRESAEAVIARADNALYRAKHAGRDRTEVAGAGGTPRNRAGERERDRLAGEPADGTSGEHSDGVGGGGESEAENPAGPPGRVS